MVDSLYMQRFRFRLASVLRLRSQTERAARRDLAVSMAEVNTLDQQLEAADRGLSDCADQGARGDSVGDLARALEGGLRRHRWQLERRRGQAAQQLEVARADYVEKARDVKTLQRLHDDELAQWRQDAQRAEQAEIDDLAVLCRDANSGDGSW